MKIAFLWNFDRAQEVYPNWRDGLRAALEEIAKEHQLDIFLGQEAWEVPDDYEALLFWTDSNDPIIDRYVGYKAKKGLCLTTDPHNILHLRNYDVVYCESTPVLDMVRANGLRAIKAFGTDIDFYCPDEAVTKDVVAFYPATFSPWKRQQDIAGLGEKLVCIGTVQPDGEEELAACKKYGVITNIGYFPPETIREGYRRAQIVPIPAVHGSERTVLEAMSCGTLPIVYPQNKKAHSFLLEYAKSDFRLVRDFVVAQYSHTKYAQDLLRGLL